MSFGGKYKGEMNSNTLELNRLNKIDKTNYSPNLKDLFSMESEEDKQKAEAELKQKCTKEELDEWVRKV